jgi:hypothetical protein
VVHGPRGVEIGDVLLSSDCVDSADGEVLRIATERDDEDAARLSERAQLVLAAASACGAGLRLSFVDVEATFDGTVILHAIAWETSDASGLLDELEEQFGLRVRMLDLALIATTKETAGCGKPNCGSGSGGCSSCGNGGGCSTGSCSRGTVKSAEELATYFAGLRQQMELTGFVRTPLT